MGDLILGVSAVHPGHGKDAISCAFMVLLFLALSPAQGLTRYIPRGINT